MDQAPRNDPPLTPENAPPTLKLRLSVALYKLLNDRGDQPFTLGYLIDTTGERATAILMAFLCLPFVQPIPLPGISIPFGLTLALLGFQMAWGNHHPWIPKRMKSWRLPPRLTTPLLRGIAKIFNPLEKIIKPRYFVMQNPIIISLIGLGIAIDGLLLALLPPLPFANLIPAWLAMIKILGITEEDGFLILLGLILFFVTIALIIIGFIFGIDIIKIIFPKH